MKKSFALIACSLLACTAASAQLSVSSATGKVNVGPVPAGPGGIDGANALRMHVFGPNAASAGAKIGLGDFGTYAASGWNVFIGEFTDTDSDQMWLHGKLGSYFTYGGRAENIYGYYDVAAGNIFHYNCDVYSYGVALASDARFKTNVKEIGNATEQLKKLRGVSYNLLPHELNKAKGLTPANGAATTDLAPVSEKDKKAKALLEKLEAERNKPGEKRLGLIAQEVQKVFPELVKQDSSNYLYVDYIGLIPVMIESIKEQEELLEVQNSKIKELEDRLNSIEAKVTGQPERDKLGTPNDQKTGASYLFQNNPNPFNSSTTISYYLSPNTQSASLHIFDMQGNMLKTFPLQGTGKGEILISGSELNPGMYLYNLVTNGQEADIKRMTLIK